MNSSRETKTSKLWEETIFFMKTSNEGDLGVDLSLFPNLTEVHPQGRSPSTHALNI